tara:strand:- start:329 stop:598 length:270 start_codon:yes stop_codon:yes gene_type:complete
MLVESLLFDKLTKSKESFDEKEKETKKALTFWEIVILILVGLYLGVLILLWLRIVFNAFSCSAGQGVSSVIFPGLYSLYKFGDLIKLTC